MSERGTPQWVVVVMSAEREVVVVFGPYDALIDAQAARDVVRLGDCLASVQRCRYPDIQDVHFVVWQRGEDDG